jgi:hypothetical protein
LTLPCCGTYVHLDHSAVVLDGPVRGHWRNMTDEKKQISVELRDQEAEGIYANFAAITHSPAEFVMDFIRVLPGTKKSRVYARIVMAPQNVKAFVRALEDNIAKYEQRYGEIRMVGEAQPGKQIGFQ